MIPSENNKKLITCWATTVSCEFYWVYHADFSLKWKISLLEKKNNNKHTHMQISLKVGFAQISLTTQKV